MENQKEIILPLAIRNTYNIEFNFKNRRYFSAVFLFKFIKLSEIIRVEIHTELEVDEKVENNSN